MEAATGAPTPDIRFFHMGRFTIGGRQVRALRHGMVGQPGCGNSSAHGTTPRPFARRSSKAGQSFGIRQVGSRTYPTSCLESGWIPSPLPAIYTGQALKGYREWLKPTSYEAMASLGGSFTSTNISDYYLTPWDLGYGQFVKFDHDFVGRAALEKLAAKPMRTKVTLVWNGDDVERALGSLFSDRGDIAKYIDLPLANYSTLPYDRVLSGGRAVGLSTYTGYNFNERALLSLAIVDNDHSRPGTEVSVVWGEENGGTTKPTVERHTQATIRAVVQPAPIFRSGSSRISTEGAQHDPGDRHWSETRGRRLRAAPSGWC